MFVTARPASTLIKSFSPETKYTSPTGPSLMDTCSATRKSSEGQLMSACRFTVLSIRLFVLLVPGTRNTRPSRGFTGPVGVVVLGIVQGVGVGVGDGTCAWVYADEANNKITKIKVRDRISEASDYQVD